MVQTRDSSEARDRWENNAGNRQNYEAGVESPLRSWSEETAASEETWGEAVRAAADRGALGQGVQRSSDQEWQEKALEVGAGRINQGVKANTDKYEDRVARYIDVIESTDLPARGPSGDVDANIERARAMAQALADEKRQG